MVDDNTIDLETGVTVYVGILEKLPNGFRWIHELHTDDWLEIVHNLKSRVVDGSCPECQQSGGYHKTGCSRWLWHPLPIP